MGSVERRAKTGRTRGVSHDCCLEHPLLLMQVILQLPSAIPVPSCLYEASSPRTPLLGVKSEGVPELLAVEPPVLVGHKLQVMSPQGETFELRQRLHRPG